MAKRMIAIIMIVMMLCINVNAEVLAPAQNVPQLIALDQQYVNGRWNPTTYAGDSYGAVSADSNYRRPTIAIWQSRMMAGEFYKINIDLSPDNEYRPNFGTTGFLEKSDDMCVYLVDATKLVGNLDLSETMYGTRQWGKQIGLEETDRVPDDNYQMFYDTTTRTLSVLLMTDTNMTDYYIVVRMGRWTEDMTQSGQIFFRYAVNQIEGAYTDILQDIKEILQESTGGGGGLTEEQVNEAIQEALIAHEQWQENQGNQMIGDAEETLEEHFGQYYTAADEIRESLSGISEALAYSGTDGVLVLPEARNPMADNALLWTRREIDLVAAWNGIPQALRSVVSIVVTMSILTAIAKEVLSILEMWNTEKDLFGR